MATSPLPEPCAPIQLGEFLQGNHKFPAVYFLYRDGQVVYVGQTKTLDWRIEAHLQQNLKSFDAVSYLRCCVTKLLEIETAYIRKLRPAYNRCMIARKAKEDAGLGWEDQGQPMVPATSIRQLKRKMAKEAQRKFRKRNDPKKKRWNAAKRKEVYAARAASTG